MVKVGAPLSWLKTYKEYTENTESPDSFHFWVSVGTIASALGRKVWIDLGHIQIYPNFFIILVAPPGRCRKTQAIRIGESLARSVTTIRLASDSITREALIRDLSLSISTFPLNEGQILNHCSISMFSTELSVFLGQRNLPMLSMLCELYDCKDEWEYKTKMHGKDTLYGVYFNLIGATTPEWLNSSLPLDAIGGGLLSRAIMVVEYERKKKVTWPSFNPAIKEKLMEELEDIAGLAGPIYLDDEAFKFYDNWYLKLPDVDFDFAERKHIIVLKLAIVSAVSNRRSKIVKEDITFAIDEISKIEPRMPEALGGVGRGRFGPTIHKIMVALNKEEYIPVSELMRRLWKDITKDELNQIIASLIAMGFCVYDFSGKEPALRKRRG